MLSALKPFSHALPLIFVLQTLPPTEALDQIYYRDVFEQASRIFSLLILQGVNEPISRSKLAKSADSHLLIVCWLEALPCELQWYLLKQISEWSAFFTLPYYYLRHNRAFSCDLIDAMLEGKNNTFSLPWEIRSIFMENCFIVSALQHGRREKLL